MIYPLKKRSHCLLSGNLGGHSFRIGQYFELQRKKITPTYNGEKMANSVFYNLRKILTSSSNLINIVSCYSPPTWHYFIVFYYPALLNIAVEGWNLGIPILDLKCILIIYFLDVLFFPLSGTCDQTITPCNYKYRHDIYMAL